jgi:hypothetical protein
MTLMGETSPETTSCAAEIGVNPRQNQRSKAAFFDIGTPFFDIGTPFFGHYTGLTDLSKKKYKNFIFYLI